MQEQDITPSQKFVNTLITMIKANNRDIPIGLAMLHNKEKKNALKDWGF